MLDRLEEVVLDKLKEAVLDRIEERVIPSQPRVTLIIIVKELRILILYNGLTFEGLVKNYEKHISIK